jgi:hypothetical protein
VCVCVCVCLFLYSESPFDCVLCLFLYSESPFDCVLCLFLYSKSPFNCVFVFVHGGSKCKTKSNNHIQLTNIFIAERVRHGIWDVR